MNQAEYDRLNEKIAVAPVELAPEPIIVDGRSVAPLRITVVNSTPEEMYQREMEELQPRERIVGYTEDGKVLVRKIGGADYAGAEHWIRLMQRCGRYKGF